MANTDMRMVNSFDASSTKDLSPQTRDLVERRQRSLGAAYRLFYSNPVHFTRGEGVLLFDAEGRDYLDAYNNVPVVGHSNLAVHDAVSAQLLRLNTHTRYLTDGVISYAERLLALFPPYLDNVVFACTGSEAVDLALRVSRHVTGRRGVVETRHAYHGTTQSAAEVSPSLGRGATPSPTTSSSWMPPIKCVTPSRARPTLLDNARGKQSTGSGCVATSRLRCCLTLRSRVTAFRSIRRASLLPQSRRSERLAGSSSQMRFKRDSGAPVAGGDSPAMGSNPILSFSANRWETGYPSRLWSVGQTCWTRSERKSGTSILSVETPSAWLRPICLFLDQIIDRGLLLNAATVGADIARDLHPLVAKDPGVAAVR